MKLSTAIIEYDDTELLRYLQEEIENQGRQEELMQMITRRTTNRKTSSLQMALNYKKSKEVIFKIMEMGGRELLMKIDGYGYTALYYACYNELDVSMEIISKMLEIISIETSSSL